MRALPAVSGQRREQAYWRTPCFSWRRRCLSLQRTETLDPQLDRSMFGERQCSAGALQPNTRQRQTAWMETAMNRDASHATFRRAVFAAGRETQASEWSGPSGTERAWLWRLTDWCSLAAARNRRRQALAELDDWLLRDIGKTRLEIQMEAGEPRWRKMTDDVARVIGGGW